MLKGKVKEHKINKEDLSSGICDNCIHPKMINTGGDGIQEPAYEELYCKKKELFIQPQPKEDRVMDCEFYAIKMINPRFTILDYGTPIVLNPKKILPEPPKN